MDEKRHGRNVGYECFQCKAYSGPPEPCWIITDTCDQCEEIVLSEDE